MKLKMIAAGICALTLAACGDNAQNPEMLKGAKFVSAQPGVDITLAFDPVEMRVNGKVVNLYNGPYMADGDKINFGEIVTTMMMGEPEAMETEQEYMQFIPTVEKYELSDGKLTLIATDGKEIIFTQVDALPGEAPTTENVEVVTETVTE